MSGIVLDAETSGGTAPEAIPLDSLPSFEGPATGRPLVLAGERAAVLGEEATGIREILLHPVRALAGFQAGLPGAARIRVAPGAARRHLSSGLGDVVESILVYRRLPGAVLRWSREAAGSGGRPLQLSLAWVCPGAEAPTAGDAFAGQGRLRLPLTDRPEELLFVLLGSPGRWRIEERATDEGPGLRLGLRSFLGSGRSVALAVTLIREGGREADAVLARLDRLSAEVAAWADDARQDERDGLALESSDGAPGRALAWALRRLPATVVRPGGRRPGRVVSGYGRGCPGREGSAGPGSVRPAHDHPAPAPLPEIPWIGHGLLAAGRHADALDVVTRGLDRVAGGEGGAPDGASGATAAEALVVHLAARYVLWTGDARPLGRAGEAVDAAVERIGAGLAGGRPTSAVPAAAAAYRDLAEAMEAAGRPDRARTLRSRWEALRDRLEGAAQDEGRARREAPPPDTGPGPGGAGGRRLPVLPGPPTRPSAPAGSRRSAGLPDPGVLAAVLNVPGPGLAAGGPAGEPRGGAGAGLLAWALWERGDPEAALRAWRELVVAGVEERRGLWGLEPTSGGRGVGTGSGQACPWHSATTALTVAPLVSGFLGARADAAYGRLRLAPRIPAEWKGFELRGLRIGDVRLRLGYRREGRRHTFVLAPTAGRVPLNVVFEPILPARAVKGVRVGGEAADVDAYRHRGRAGIRLQLPLDSRREIEVDGADGQD